MLVAFLWWANQKPAPVVLASPLVEKTQSDVVLSATPAVPLNVVANNAEPVKTKPLKINQITEKSIVKQSKHTTLLAHHHEKPLGVTYTVKPVSPAEFSGSN